MQGHKHFADRRESPSRCPPGGAPPNVAKGDDLPTLLSQHHVFCCLPSLPLTAGAAESALTELELSRVGIQSSRPLDGNMIKTSEFFRLFRCSIKQIATENRKCYVYVTPLSRRRGRSDRQCVFVMNLQLLFEQHYHPCCAFSHCSLASAGDLCDR